MRTKFLVPGEEYIYSGHGACPGCAMPLVLRTLYKLMGSRTVVVSTAGCHGTISGVYPASPFKLATYNTPFPSLGAAAIGLRAGLDMKGEQETQVVAIGGDGGVFDIGLQSISRALERNENILFICYDNEAYMNTGIQGSSSTPSGAWTTTNPTSAPKSYPKKDLLGIIAAHRIPYAASASIGYLDDYLAKIEKAMKFIGSRFLHVISPCPVGWRFPSELTLKIARLAVQSRVFPLYEIEDGKKYKMTMDPSPVIPVKDYMALQGRFKHLPPEAIAGVQAWTEENWEILSLKTRCQ
jgi:pyruvate/2-oxoacid:ferredoxin oxidoreductase beta subunit